MRCLPGQAHNIFYTRRPAAAAATRHSAEQADSDVAARVEEQSAALRAHTQMLTELRGDMNQLMLRLASLDDAVRSGGGGGGGGGASVPASRNRPSPRRQVTPVAATGEGAMSC